MKKPPFRIYVIAEPEVNLDSAKFFLRKKFHAFRIAIVKGDDIGSIVFNIPMHYLNNMWRYFQQKKGIRKVWIGHLNQK